MKVVYETRTCGRCGGSGKYSWNPSDGDRCFGCLGKGTRLTARGRRAHAAIEAQLTVTTADLKVGQRIRTTGITIGGQPFRYNTRITALPGPTGSTCRYKNGDGPWVEKEYHTVEYLELGGKSTVKDHTFLESKWRILPNRDELVAAVAAVGKLKGMTVEDDEERS